MFRAIRLAEMLFTWAILSPLFSLQWINELNQLHIWVTAKCEYSYDQFCFNRAEIYINVRNRNRNEIIKISNTSTNILKLIITTDLKWKANLKS